MRMMTMSVAMLLMVIYSYTMVIDVQIVDDSNSMYLMAVKKLMLRMIADVLLKPFVVPWIMMMMIVMMMMRMEKLNQRSMI